MNLALCRSTAARTVVAAALLPSLLLLAGGAFADDRDLFRASSTSPLVMTILDTSASMHLQPDGSFAPAGADDPNSRFYQAKAALYEVIDTLGGDLVFGWAHFNQEEMQVLQKRWLYAGELTSGDPASPFAPTGGPISLGPRPAGLTVGSACNKEDLLVASSMEAVELFPKLGAGTSDTLFVLLGLQELRIDFSLSAGALGDESATLTYSVASVPGCGGEVGGADVFTVALSPAYTADLDLHPFETGRGFDYLQYSEAIDTPFPHPVKDYDVRSACDPPSNDSWMANENGATTDPLASERLGGRANGDDGDEALAYDNFPPPSGPFCTTQGNPFVRGDIVPFDWLDRADGSLGWEVGARAEIRRRLAPNTAFDPGAAPDFRIARYFQPAAGGGLELVPQPVGGLAADRYPPILTGAGTPLAGVLDDLHHYFSEFTACAEDETEGDVRFPCRQRYLILVTDGEENCDGAVAAAARSLQRDHGFKIFVIGFGADVDAGELQTIADEGGTGTFDVDGDGAVDCEELSTSTFDFCPGPQVAADKMELVAALDRAFGAVQPNPATFSAATAPEASADTDDSIFLSTFFPVDFTNTYPGKLFHFIRPLPLRQDAAGRFVADEGEVCTDDEDLSCLAWEADAVIRGFGFGGLDQVPTLAQARGGTYLLGGAATERRLFYAQEPAPARVKLDTRLLTPPASATFDEADLLTGMGLLLTEDGRIPPIVAGVVAEKTASNPLDATETFTYILPDFFHSSPRLAGSPARAEYLIQNLPAGSSLDCNTSKGYRCFFEKHRYRRKVLLAGGSDAQLHAFDAGTFDSQVNGGLQEGTFNRGTGQELFAYVPRALLPRLVDFEDDPSLPSLPPGVHAFGVDNPVRIDDVFIDPEHTDSPIANQREWRTVAIGTLREGGRSVFALDLTQPDPLTTEGGAQVPQTNDYVPSCMEYTGAYSSGSCGPVPYGSVLWEFEDQCALSGAACSTSDPLVADEDGDGKPDLGDTWSVPNTGRVRINVGGTVVDRYVAIFGGGIDCQVESGVGCKGTWDLSVGSWLYMVDIETGKALYKRQLDGPAPSSPAAVDTNRDGVLDTVWIGTLAGSMYKVDLSAVPTLSNGRVDAAFWQPVRFFTTCDLASRPSSNDPLVAPALECPPIFLPPSVFFVQQAGGLFALAFGTGDRSDLWSRESEVGKFYEIVDCSVGVSPCPLPRVASSTTSTTGTFSDYPRETAASLSVFSDNPLFDSLGYVLELGAGEKLVSDPFVLGGITVFSTFVPSDQQVLAGQQLCFFRGVSNLFSLFTATGNAVAADGGSSRFRSAEGLVSNPFTETSGRAGEGDGEDGGQGTEDEVDPDLERIRNELMSFFPPNCRFSSLSIDIKALRSDTGIEFIAPVPVCVVEKNWREF